MRAMQVSLAKMQDLVRKVEKAGDKDSTSGDNHASFVIDGLQTDLEQSSAKRKKLAEECKGLRLTLDRQAALLVELNADGVKHKLNELEKDLQLAQSQKIKALVAVRRLRAGKARVSIELAGLKSQQARLRGSGGHGRTPEGGGKLHTPALDNASASIDAVEKACQECSGVEIRLCDARIAVHRLGEELVSYAGRFEAVSMQLQERDALWEVHFASISLHIASI